MQGVMRPNEPAFDGVRELPRTPQDHAAAMAELGGGGDWRMVAADVDAINKDESK